MSVGSNCASGEHFDVDARHDFFGEKAEPVDTHLTGAQKEEALHRQHSQESFHSHDSHGLSNNSISDQSQISNNSFASDDGVNLQSGEHKRGEYTAAQDQDPFFTDAQAHLAEHGEFRHEAQQARRQDLAQIDGMRDKIGKELNFYRSNQLDIEKPLTDQELNQRIQEIKREHVDFASLSSDEQMKILYSIEDGLQNTQEKPINQFSNDSSRDHYAGVDEKNAPEPARYEIPKDIADDQRVKMELDLKALEDKDVIRRLQTATLWKTTSSLVRILDVSQEKIKNVSREQQSVYNDLKNYLNQGGNPNLAWIEPGDKKDSLMQRAIELGNKDIVRLLLDRGAMLDGKSLGQSLSQYSDLNRSSIQYKDGNITATLVQDIIQASKSISNTIWKFIDRFGEGWKNISKKSFMGKLFSLPEILSTPTPKQRALEEYHNQLVSRADIVFELYARGVKVEHEDQQQAIKELESEYSSLWNKVSTKVRRAWNAPSN